MKVHTIQDLNLAARQGDKAQRARKTHSSGFFSGAFVCRQYDADQTSNSIGYGLGFDSTGTRNSTGTAGAVSALAFSGSTIGATPVRQCLGKFFEPNLTLVDLCQFIGQRRKSWVDLAEKIEKHRFSIEQMFDIDEHAGKLTFLDQTLASHERFVAMSLESLKNQFVFGADSTKDFSINR